jgi:hypothetical protein
LDEDLQDRTGSPRVVIEPLAELAGIGELLAPYVGWTFRLDLGRGNEPPGADGAVERIRVRAPTPAETRSAERACTKAGAAYFLDSSHYLTPAGWALGRERDRLL